MREHELLQSVLEELGDRLGCADRTWLVDPSMRWQDDFVLTGADVHGDAPYRVWRFSPFVPSEFAPIVEKPKPGSAGAMGNVSLPVRLLLSPGSMASCVIRFADAAISQGPSSAFGWWIKQPATSHPPTVNCSDGQALRAWPLKVDDEMPTWVGSPCVLTLTRRASLTLTHVHCRAAGRIPRRREARTERRAFGDFRALGR